MAHQFEPGISGFTKAQYPNRQSITICNESSYDLDMPAIIAPWNRAAGWPLLAIGCPGDITLVTSDGTWVQPYPTYRKPYTSCVIFVSSPYATTYWMVHEIGHALGFSDHFYTSFLDDPRYNNPELYGELKICDDRRHPYYSPYRGVMSYCSPYPWQWFRQSDLQMLQAAGYR